MVNLWNRLCVLPALSDYGNFKKLTQRCPAHLLNLIVLVPVSVHLFHDDKYIKKTLADCECGHCNSIVIKALLVGLAIAYMHHSCLTVPRLRPDHTVPITSFVYCVCYCLLSWCTATSPTVGWPPWPLQGTHSCSQTVRAWVWCGWLLSANLRSRKGKSVFRVQVRCSCSYSVEYELDVADYLKPICGVRKQCMSKQWGESLSWEYKWDVAVVNL